MRIEIEKKKGQSCILLNRGETRREKKEKMTVGDKPTTICCHAPHHMKEDTMVHLMRQRKVRFDH
jgi:ethanolamine utilization cobalamin adenosyltransferase